MGHDSHGVQMLPQYFAAIREGRLKTNVRLTRLSAPRAPPAAADGADDGAEDGTDDADACNPILSYDARGSFGQASCHDAMVSAIKRAQRLGVCLVTVRDAHHIGRVGSYAEQVGAPPLLLLLLLLFLMLTCG